MFDVVAIGDTTQDIFLKMHDATLQCDINHTNCKISFDYAAKIAVEEKQDIPAVGNAANHAIGIARLGLRSAIYTVVGDDAQGHTAAEILGKNGVNLQFLTYDKKHGTNLSVVINFKGERTIFVYHEPRDYKLPDLDGPGWVYLTSAAKEGVEQLHQQTEDFLEKHPAVKLAFNPGTHQLHLGKEKLSSLLSRCDILFLNREESVGLLESSTNKIDVLVNGFHELGVKIMVLTDGSAGAYVSDGRQIWFMNIFAGDVVERTGAGDAYGSGFLSAIIKGHDIPTAMAWGDANSTSVVRYVGAREGLLTEDAVSKMIAENPTIKAEVWHAT